MRLKIFEKSDHVKLRKRIFLHSIPEKSKAKPEQNVEIFSFFLGKTRFYVDFT